MRNFGPLRNFNYYVPLYARTHRPILVPIEYLERVRGSTKCIRVIFNLLCRDWSADNLANREPAQEEKVLNYLLAMQPYSNADLKPRAPAACFEESKSSATCLTWRRFWFRQPLKGMFLALWGTVPIQSHSSRKIQTEKLFKIFFFVFIYLLFISFFLSFLNPFHQLQNGNNLVFFFSLFGT